MTTAVVDASVMVDALTASGARAEAAIGALLDFDYLAAPHLLDLECASAWRRLVHARHLAPREAKTLVGLLARAPIDRIPTWQLGERIWELSGSVTAYDSAYLALAEALDAPLLTADRRLRRAPGARCEVRIVVD